MSSSFGVPSISNITASWSSLATGKLFAWMLVWISRLSGKMIFPGAMDDDPCKLARLPSSFRVTLHLYIQHIIFQLPGHDPSRQKSSVTRYHLVTTCPVNCLFMFFLSSFNFLQLLHQLLPRFLLNFCLLVLTFELITDSHSAWGYISPGSIATYSKPLILTSLPPSSFNSSAATISNLLVMSIVCDSTSSERKSPKSAIWTV